MQHIKVEDIKKRDADEMIGLRVIVRFPLKNKKCVEFTPLIVQDMTLILYRYSSKVGAIR